MARKTQADLLPESVDDERVEQRLAAKTQGAVLGSTREEADKSWAAVGVDTSMSSIAAVAVGYDAKLDKRVGPTFGEIRWQPETDYYVRLGDAVKAHDLVLDLLRKLWVIHPNRVWVAFEEPFHYGAAQRNIGAWLKQQAEIAGAAKGSLVRYGFPNIVEINNSQWHKALRKEGVEFQPPVKGGTDKEKRERALANKFVVKTWATQAFGLPDLPDLVKSKGGAKIPRPESGFGAKAKAEQPSDVYDAAAVCAWMLDTLEEQGIAS